MSYGSDIPPPPDPTRAAENQSSSVGPAFQPGHLEQPPQPQAGYPMPQPAPQPTQIPTLYPGLRALLSTKDGFERAVKLHHASDGVVGAILGIAAVALLWNTVVTLIAFFELPSFYRTAEIFFRVFFSTINESGDFSPWLFMIVWVPVVTVPALLVLLIVRRATRSGSVQKAFDRFSQGGSIGLLYPTQIQFKVNNATQHICAYFADWLDPATGPAALTWLQQTALGTPQSPEAANLVRGLEKAPKINFWDATPATAIDPRLPAGMYLTRLILSAAKLDRPFVLIPNPTTGAGELHFLVEDVPIG